MEPPEGLGGADDSDELIVPLSPVRRWLLLVGPFVVLVVVGIAALVYLLSTVSDREEGPRFDDYVVPALPSVPAESVVLDLRGIGEEITVPFEVLGGWEILWSTAGETLTIDLALGSDVQRIVDHRQGPGLGTAEPAQVGLLRLRVDSDAAWALRVVQRRVTG